MKDEAWDALRENEAVVIIIMWILGVVTHVPKEKRGHEVSRRAAGGRVPAAGLGSRCNRMDAQLVGDPFQSLNVNIVHEWPLM